MVMAEEDLTKELTPAEARMEARRRKILQNQEGRFQKILGPNSELAAKRIVASQTHPPAEDPVLPEEFLTLDFLQKAKYQQTSAAAQSNNAAAASPSNSKAAPGKAISKNYRYFISLLGLVLPFLDLNYFLLYFILMEICVLAYYRQVPLPPSPPNIIFTLILVLGLKEQDINRIKLTLRISTWIFQDLCFFILSSIIPQLIIGLMGT